MSTFIAENRKYINWLLYLIVAVVLVAWLQPLLAENAPNQIVQRTIGGLLLGGIYATIALGIVVINKASGVFNFAHGGMMMVSAYLFFTFFTTQEISVVAAALLAIGAVTMILASSGWGNLLKPMNAIGGVFAVIVLTLLMTQGDFVQMRWIHAIVGSICGTVFMGLAIERFTIRPLIGQPVFAAVMVTLALAEVLDGITKLIWGAQPRSLLVFSEPGPEWMGEGALVRIQKPITLETTELLGGVVNIDQPRLIAFVLAIIAFSLFFAFFRFTNIGLAMRASSENQQLAEAVGLRVRTILAITWAIAAVLAGIAGILYAGSSSSSSLDTGIQFIALRAFPAVLLGGLESIGGALIGGLLLGLTEEWAKLLFSGDIAENLAPYVLLMIVLILRPEGLFGEKRIDRV